MNTSLLAPCGMNCGICLAFLRDKNKCQGCRINPAINFKSIDRCIIRNCIFLEKTASGFCYDCEKFPCLRLKQLDKRYRTKYRMSMIENLNSVRFNGLDGNGEIGADTSTMVALIRENITKSKLRILDLGCGKGAVSVNLAREIDCVVKGVDAMPNFIKSAGNYAIQFNVHDKCDFETGDIRIKIMELKKFDVIILGAIGPVFGDLFTTLKTLTASLNPDGYVLLDDGFIHDESQTNYNRCLRKTSFKSIYCIYTHSPIQLIIHQN